MIKIKYLTLAALMIIFCLGNVFAQAIDVTPPGLKDAYNDDVFFKLQDNAQKELGGRVFRQTTLTERFENGRNVPTTYEKDVNEMLPPDRSRFTVEEKTKDGIKRKEYIDIGRERFIRENGGKWKIFEPTGSGNGAGSGDGKSEGVKITYTVEKNFVAGEIINGQKTDRYQEILRYTYTYPTRVEKITVTNAFWFNAKGLLIKKLEESRNETKKSIYRTTELYQYDINLKIEKPVVN
jgi:hypothetical protein